MEEMIFLAGHASSTYLDLFKAYNSVLEANNFDPADDVLSVPLLFSVPLDEPDLRLVAHRYYRFILKLSMVPGTNWGERWERWKLDTRAQPGPSSLPSTTPRTSPVRSTVSLPTSSLDLTSEVPWRRSGERVMIEGEESWEQEEYNEEEGTLSSARDDSEDDIQTDGPASGGGYRSYAKQRTSIGSLSPPQRHSTPLEARSSGSRSRNQHHRASIPPRPPPSPPRPRYNERTASPLSVSSTSTYPPLSDRPSSIAATPLHLHTPTPRHLSPSIPTFLFEPNPAPRAPLSSKHHHHNHTHKPSFDTTRSLSPPVKPMPFQLLPKVPKVVSESRALIEAELQREDEERDRRRQDELRGDQFYEMGLLGRCWDIWRKGREWVLVSRSCCFLLVHPLIVASGPADR